MTIDKFKTLARDLRRHTSRIIPLSTAQAIIARAHGYRDWHHAEQGQQDKPAHSEDIRQAIAKGIVDAAGNRPTDDILYALVPDELPVVDMADEFFDGDVFDTKVDAHMYWIGRGETFEDMMASIAQYLGCNPDEVAVVRTRRITAAGAKTKVDSFRSMSDSDLGSILSRVPGAVRTDRPHAEWNVPVEATVTGRTAIALARRYQIMVRHDEEERGHWSYAVSRLRPTKLEKAMSGHLGNH